MRWLVLEHLISNHRREIMMMINAVLACLGRLMKLRWVLLAHEHLCPPYSGADPRFLSVKTEDSRPLITGHSHTSLWSLERLFTSVDLLVQGLLALRLALGPSGL